MLGTKDLSSPPVYVIESGLGPSKVGKRRLRVIVDGLDEVPAQAESQIVVRPKGALRDWDGLLR